MEEILIKQALVFNPVRKAVILKVVYNGDRPIQGPLKTSI